MFIVMDLNSLILMTLILSGILEIVKIIKAFTICIVFSLIILISAHINFILS